MKAKIKYPLNRKSLQKHEAREEKLIKKEKKVIEKLDKMHKFKRK